MAGGSRAGAPGASSEHRATLERVTAWTESIRSLFLRLASGMTLSFDPGQFISLALPIGERPPLVRAYSIASSPEDGGLLEICVDRVPGGAGSGYLFGLEPGAEVVLTGPFGGFKLAEPPQTDLVFVSHGTGIAPIRPMVGRALARGGEHALAVLQGYDRGGPLLYGGEFAALAASESRLHWQPIVADAAAGPLDNPTLERVVRERYVDAGAIRARHFWICGVGNLATRLRRTLRGAGYDRRAVRCERW